MHNLAYLPKKWGKYSGAIGLCNIKMGWGYHYSLYHMSFYHSCMRFWYALLLSLILHFWTIIFSQICLTTVKLPIATRVCLEINKLYLYIYIYVHIYMQTLTHTHTHTHIYIYIIKNVCMFETWSSQTKDFKIDTCHFLAWRLALFG